MNQESGSVGKGVLAVLGFLALFVLLVVFSLVFRWEVAPWVGQVEQREIVEGSGEFRIHSYNHFFDLCAEIQQTEARYDTQYDELQEMESGTDSYDRQRRNVAVLLQRVEELKRQYNADAAREDTIGAFRDSDLPNRIDPVDHEHGRRTQCVWGDQ